MRLARSERRVRIGRRRQKRSATQGEENMNNKSHVVFSLVQLLASHLALLQPPLGVLAFHSHHEAPYIGNL